MDKDLVSNIPEKGRRIGPFFVVPYIPDFFGAIENYKTNNTLFQEMMDERNKNAAWAVHEVVDGEENIHLGTVHSQRKLSKLLGFKRYSASDQNSLIIMTQVKNNGLQLIAKMRKQRTEDERGEVVLW